MKLSYKRTIISFAGALLLLNGNALNLPTKAIGNRQYYYYTVGAHETVYGVSRKLGISREDIVRNNPAAADGLRNGTVLYFPVEEFSDQETTLGEIPDESAITPPVTTENNFQVSVSEQGTSQPAHAMTAVIDPSIAIVLPFGGGGNSSRQEKLYLDFYKGFLLGTDSLSGYTAGTTITLDVTNSSVDSPASNLDMNSVVILPGNSAGIDSISATGTYILSLFDTRDTMYMNNPYAIQANVPAATMYEKAIETITTEMPGYIPVILSSASGRNEKAPFTDALRRHCDNYGLEYIEVSYDGNLQRSDLSALADSLNYVIIPSSGTLGEFNRFVHVVMNFKASHNASSEQGETTGRVAVFGYPDWLAFRGEASMMLHQLEATIYSRFFDNPLEPQTRRLSADFYNWYGEAPLESVPSQAILGFDTACYLIRSMQANNGVFSPMTIASYTGVQSAFKFEQVNGGGWVNTALYIIRYLPDGTMQSKII